MSMLKVVKRTGEIVDFDVVRIRNALLKAVRAVAAKISPEELDLLVKTITEEIESRFTDFYPNVENIQDVVEKHLVKAGWYEVAKAYILYRSERQKEREQQKEQVMQRAKLGKLTVQKRDGKQVLFNLTKLRKSLERASKGYEHDVDLTSIEKEVIKNIYDQIPTGELAKAIVLASTAFIERDPAYNKVAARLFLQKLYKEVFDQSMEEGQLHALYQEAFVRGIQEAVASEIMDKQLLSFNLETLAQGLKPERDDFFTYLGLQTLYERYFVTCNNKKLELPQSFWMRVAMGLALHEPRKEAAALSFYEALSSLRVVSSTPTLFHSGLAHPQLSSCYLTTINDDLSHIFKCIGDNAQLSKWSGGLGNDWTNIRATGADIQSTKVESQGVVPFLKIANDVTVAINRSGKRRGATCAYLETWHLDIEDFLDLRKNTGDERRRTHDMNTANWIPDLFMKRVIAHQDWTLFSPHEVPDLHHSYGRAFEQKYTAYEQQAKEGKIKRFKVIPAQQLWRKMITMLFETGHPWMTFKDPCNVRSPQDHVGVVHSSNLCTEITLNTSAEETAVCNLASINLARHVEKGRLDKELLGQTIAMTLRMLDNVIDINFYPTQEAKQANLRHRPVGLGVMGLQDVLFMLDLPFDNEEAVRFADELFEFISFHAILASSLLAKERGTYASYKGSKWDRGIFPIDSLQLLEQERGVAIEVPKDTTLPWEKVREHVQKYGMRNSNTMAIAPTATISNIAGCFPCIEPIYKNIYVKANISGEFTIVNTYLVEDLKKLHLWNQEMLELLKYYDGNLQMIAGIPEHLKEKYKEAFTIDPHWIIRHAAVRQKWIDQSQSVNIFYKGTSGRELHDIYLYAWRMGLKTTYYLRSLGASQIEKSTLDAAKYGFTQKREYKALASETSQQEEEGLAMQEGVKSTTAEKAPKVCSLNDPHCEACQ
ncbi:ribonucleoside-diphosphate reductase subunit alpha [Candidatus Woesearchaeota archaeon]|nr:ribonucleoside-diphosphate reductase subunit alpha [Candidatus Woesearchaeota archaeon]